MRNKIWEKIFGAPAELLEKTIELEEEIQEDIVKQKPVKKVKEYWKILGPGLTTGAADDDPSGIATYSQMGAEKGFGLIWLSLFTFPLMSVVQEMCARIGVVTGIGLAANIKRHYSKKVLYFCTALLVFANIFNIGADLGAMAKGVQLIFPFLSFALVVIVFALVILLLQIFVPYKTYSSYLKYLTLVLFTYIFSALSMNIDWGNVIKHLVIPQFSFGKEEIILICAALGTTISPYLFFWQTSQEVEDQIMKGDATEKMRREHTTKKDIRDMRIDVWSGMFMSNMVMFFIIAACAATLYVNGITHITSAADAALALRPFAGDSAFFLFAIGIIGTGLLAIPVLAGSSSYAVSESFGFKFGLYRKLKEASAFYGVIIIAMVLGILLNFVGFDPIQVLIYSAVFNGLISPIMLFLIVRISSNEKIMGEYKNKNLSRGMGWLTVVLMSMVSVASIFFLLDVF
jgi:NRAMP (natural resistance-associated macrophage protein)-like metal ion transporter